jgi:acyl-coenzyme A synthetase/AMP-(fatty) acid ligase
VLFDCLTTRADVYGNKPAVIGENRTLTFKQLLEEAKSVAVLLKSGGLRLGDVLLLGIPPSPEFYVVFHAAAALGIITLPVLPSGKIPATIINLHATAAAGSAVFLRQVRSQCPSVQLELPWERDRGLAVSSQAGELRRSQVLRDEKIIGVSSSGTTGEPTIYYRSVELLVRRAELRAQSLGITPDDVLLSARPFNSGSSINSHVIMPLLAGCSIAVQEKFQRFQAAEIIQREKVSVLYSVPFIFELLASIPPEYPVNLSSLRLCISGSAPLAKSVASSFCERFGIEIRQRYGGSHIHPAFTFNFKGVPGAVGQTYGPFPIMILDNDEQPAPPDHIGEIVFDYDRVESSWQKYLAENPNRCGRYIHTGDLGRADSDGNVFVVGRKSPFIKVRGNRVEPAEVEAVLRSYPKITEAIVYGKAVDGNEEVHAIVVSNGTVSRRDLLHHCAERLDGFKCPRKIEFRSEIPRNDHGKVDRLNLFKSASEN